VLASVMAPVEGGSGHGPAGHGRPLVSRRISWMLEPSLATATGKATHRFNTCAGGVRLEVRDVPKEFMSV
jgi:hypothetical protein